MSPLFAALEFTSLPMLGWLVAAALPWLIHRWQRRQHQTTRWAAVELLLSAMQQRARRVQMQQWLLLAVRTAILVLVALAAAEPALRQWAVGAGGRAQVHRILVIDQSYSMGCQEAEATRWERAQAEAKQWIANSDGDALTVIGWARQAENLLGPPTFDTSIALSAIDELSLSDSNCDLSVALRAIKAAIDRAKIEVPQIANHQVVFCTDLGRRTWGFDDRQHDLLESISKLASITVVNVAEGPRENVAITDLQIEPAITLQQRETSIQAKITCFGNSPSSSLSVDLLIEGRTMDRQSVEIGGNTEVTVQFKHRFIGEGAQTVRVVLSDHEDCLPCDDQRWLIADVRPRLRVACIAGQPGAVDDLVRALSPGAAAMPSDGFIDAEVFSVSQLGELKLQDFAAVVLGSVADLSSREAASLSEYVRQGGSLAVFLSSESALRLWGGLQQSLPVTFEGVQSAGEYHFDPLEYQHPVVAPFRGQAQAGLLGVTISQYVRLAIREDRPSAEIVLNFDTGDPALVVDRFGLGRIAVSALPGSLRARDAAGAPWSSFALSPSFLPVVRELVEHLVGDRWHQQRNLLVGETAMIPWPDSATSASVRRPDGFEQKLPLPAAEDRGQIIFPATDKRGVYQFRADEQDCARFSANLDGRDSDLTPIDPATLPATMSTNTVEAVVTSPAIPRDFSFVRTLLAAAMVLLMFEIGLAWMLGRSWG